MTKEEILEGNKLIAEFMGFYFRDKNTCQSIRNWVTGLETMTYNSEAYLKFHSSWDWLIPCIDKIYESDWYYKWKETLGQFEKEIFINTKFIENTWNDVIEFIKWYNKNNK